MAEFPQLELETETPPRTPRVMTPTRISAGIACLAICVLVTAQICGFTSINILIFGIIIGGTCLISSWYVRALLHDHQVSVTIPAKVRSTLDAFAEGLLVLDSDKKILLVNRAFAEKIGRAGKGLAGRNVTELPWRRDNEACQFPWDEALEKGTACTGHLIQLCLPRQNRRTFLVNAAPIVSSRGGRQGVLVSFDDVTEIEERNNALKMTLSRLEQSRDRMREQNKQLRKLATRDPLTACLNRRAFFERLEQRFHAAKSESRPLSCILTDVDHFKSINDQHGHDMGDRVLKTVAKILQGCLRSSDLLCRYGGEEFAVVVSAEIQEAVLLADRLRHAIETAEPEGLVVTASFGISTMSHAATDPQRLIHQADQALYAAKRSGRNRVHRWDKVTAEPENHEGGSSAPVREQELSIPYHAVNALFSALIFRDASTAEHCRRVADLCVAVAEKSMSPGQVYVLEVAAMLHDIGKIGVPDAILYKPAPLTPDEQRVVRIYENVGIEVLKSTLNCDRLNTILRYRRARYDKTSRGTHIEASSDLISAANILNIADAYDAMVTEQLYRPAMSQPDAFEELRRHAGRQFDPEQVELFVESVLARDASRRQDVDGEASSQVGVPATPEERLLNELSVFARHLESNVPDADQEGFQRLAAEMEQALPRSE